MYFRYAAGFLFEEISPKKKHLEEETKDQTVTICNMFHQHTRFSRSGIKTPLFKFQ